MKKILYCLCAMIMCLFCFSACGGESTQESSSSSAQEPSVQFVYNEITLAVGESVQAEVVTARPNVFVFFSVHDSSIATVSDDGVITALAEGQTICYAEFRGEKALCLIKVTAQTVKPQLSASVPYAGNAVVLYAGDSLDLQVVVKNGDEVVDGAQVTYEVASASVANVTDGVLSASSAGTMTVTITVEYEGQTAALTVSVEVVEKA